MKNNIVRPCRLSRPGARVKNASEIERAGRKQVEGRNNNNNKDFESDKGRG